jgi:membrane peptidoglycan carboxypeptidase
VFVPLADRSDGFDPWCHPKEALTERNRIVRRMAQNGIAGTASLASALQAPLEVVSGDCSTHTRSR